MSIEQLYEIFLSSHGVTTDTRRCEPQTMFFALRGESFNGNEFAAQALAAGCVCAVVDEARYAVDERCILVGDVLETLQQLAAMHRQRMGERGLKVLQITGTNGKTTTKELCAAVLSRKFSVLYTEGNLNNHIGVPLTLLRLRPEHQLAVIETGANHPGEIAALTAIVQPDNALITNVGRAHLEGFGSFEGVKRTKGELYDWLARHGRKAFVDSTNTHLCEMARQRQLDFIPYVKGRVDGNHAMMQMELELGAHSHIVATQLVGDYNMPNVLAAVTVGMHFGVDEAAIVAAIEGYAPTNKRSQLMQTACNTLIVDAYNANPSSMALAIDNFARLEGDSKLMILGDMRELGDESESEHRKILQQAIASGVQELWLVGREFAKAMPNAHESGPEVLDGRVRLFADVEAVKAHIAAQRIEHRTILVKGSNGTRLHQLPDLL